MKKSILGVLVFLFSCAPPSDGRKRASYTEAYNYNFAKHKGKTVASITYCDRSCEVSGKVLKIVFTDGTSVLLPLTNTI